MTTRIFVQGIGTEAHPTKGADVDASWFAHRR
jgi:hypothetical protein